MCKYNEQVSLQNDLDTEDKQIKGGGIVVFSQRQDSQFNPELRLLTV